MSFVKVDSSGRLHLDSLNPGDSYEPEFVSPDRITLRRVAAESQTKSLEEALARIEESPLRFTTTWDELKQETRE